MSKQWFIAVDGQRSGPVTPDELRSLAASGALGPNDLVWSEGMAKWKRARLVEGLFPTDRSKAEEQPPVPPHHAVYNSTDGNAVEAASSVCINPVWVGLAIFCFFPLGLFLLWRHPSLGSNRRWWIAGGIWTFFVLVSAINGDKSEKETASAVSTDNATEGGSSRSRPIDQVLTEDYLPHKVGSTAEYEIWIPNVGIAEHVVAFGPKGRIDRTIKKIGGKIVNIHGRSPDLRVIRDGLVGVASDGTFTECLKLNAKTGDAWEKDGTTYRLEGFSTFVSQYDQIERPTASIRGESTLPNGKTLALTSTYAKGLGLIRKEGRSPAGVVHWELVEPQKTMNLTKAERAFYDSQEPGRNPLVSVIPSQSKRESDGRVSMTGTPNIEKPSVTRYEAGFQDGLRVGESFMSQYRSVIHFQKPEVVKRMRSVLQVYDDAYEAQANGGVPSQAEYFKGQAAGFRKAVRDAGVE